MADIDINALAQFFNKQSAVVSNQALERAFAERLAAEEAASKASIQRIEAAKLASAERIKNQAILMNEREADTARRLAADAANFEAQIQAEKTARQLAQEQIDSQKRIAIRKREEEAYLQSDLNGKQEIARQIVVNSQAELKALQDKRTAGLTVSQEELAREQELQAQIDTYSKRELAMIKAKQKAALDNVPIQQKLAYLQDRVAQRTEAARKSQEAYLEDVEAAREEFGEGTTEFDDAVTMAQDRKKIRDEADDITFGVNQNDVLGSLKNLGGKSILAGLVGGTGGAAIASIISQGVSNVPYLGAILKVVKGISALVGVGVAAINKGVEKYETIYTSYFSNIQTRLQGWQSKTMDDAKNKNAYFDAIETQLENMGVTNSPYVSRAKLMENVNELVSKGIAFNIEQRAVIATLADRMVTTFNAMDATLTSLTKLRQTDMTIAALGTESTVNEFLNSRFGDTSYMNEVYDTVNSRLLDATAIMDDTEDIVSYLFNINKWLGALYANGMSATDVEKLAQGIAYLSTGDFESFNSDSALRTLFALATNGQYSNLLTSGVTADNINDLLANIVTYLASISADTNNVTKSVKAGIYGGLSLSDVKAAGNLTTSDIATIASREYSWDASLADVSVLLERSMENTNFVDKVNNVIDNLYFTIGEQLVDSTMSGVTSRIFSLGRSGEVSTYAVWKVSQVLGESTNSKLLKKIFSGINSIAGLTSLDELLNIDGDDGETSALESIIDLFSSKGSLTSSKLSLLSMLTDEARLSQTSRGTTLSKILGVTKGVSSSIDINSLNTSSADVYATSLISQANSTGSTAITDSSSTTVYDISALYSALFEEQQAIRVILADVESNAKYALTESTYNVSDNTTQLKLDALKSYSSFV